MTGTEGDRIRLRRRPESGESSQPSPEGTETKLQPNFTSLLLVSQNGLLGPKTLRKALLGQSPPHVIPMHCANALVGEISQDAIKGAKGKMPQGTGVTSCLRIS